MVSNPTGTPAPDLRIDTRARRVRARRVRARLALLASCVVAALAASGPATAQQPATEWDGGDSDGMLLQPGDLVRLKIWREPDLSGDFRVDENGIVVLPKLGPLAVTSQSPDALERQLVRAYREFLRNPSIDVVLLRRINVLGAVKAPNVYSVDPTTTLAEVIAMAGGVTDRGNPEKIEVYRDGRKVPIEFNPRTRIGDTPIRSGDHVYVPERSWFLRNSGIATLISTSVTLLVALFVR
ncbi:MAG TPA: polysaccharide biosynthesis/export family protein [Longimicrobiales bacterium]